MNFRLIFICSIFVLSQCQILAQKTTLLVGTYTNAACDSQGVYAYEFNEETADFKLLGNTENLINPSFLTWNDQQNIIYTVNENGKDSKISALKFYENNGEFELLNQFDSDEDPCYIIYENGFVYIANYFGGSVVLNSLEEDGSLSFFRQKIEYTRSGIHPRQEKSHIHQVNISPDKKYLLATNLGADEIYAYKISKDEEAPFLENEIVTKINPGAGPRHLVFDKNGKYVYLTGELDGNVYVFKLKNGKLKLKNTVSVLPKGVTENFRLADIHLSADDQFLYVTNRDGETNDITVLKTGENGHLEQIQQIKTEGENPRNFQITPNGRFVLVANQDSNQIVIFSRHEKSGKLSDTGKRIEVCAPTFVGFGF